MRRTVLPLVCHVPECNHPTVVMVLDETCDMENDEGYLFACHVHIGNALCVEE